MRKMSIMRWKKRGKKGGGGDVSSKKGKRERGGGRGVRHGVEGRARVGRKKKRKKKDAYFLGGKKKKKPLGARTMGDNFRRKHCAIASGEGKKEGPAICSR